MPGLLGMLRAVQATASASTSRSTRNFTMRAFLPGKCSAESCHAPGSTGSVGAKELPETASSNAKSGEQLRRCLPVLGQVFPNLVAREKLSECQPSISSIRSVAAVDTGDNPCFPRSEHRSCRGRLVDNPSVTLPHGGRSATARLRVHSRPQVGPTSRVGIHTIVPSV